MVGLDEPTWERVRWVFSPKRRDAAAKILAEECADGLPFCQGLDAGGLARIRFAALKLSGGSLDKLREAVDLAKIDWRDVLVAAGFALSVTAHLEWRPSLRHK